MLAAVDQAFELVAVLTAIDRTFVLEASAVAISDWKLAAQAAGSSLETLAMTISQFRRSAP